MIKQNYSVLLLLIAACISAAAISGPAPAKAPEKEPIVMIATVKGPIYIKLFPQYAPISCANFLQRVNKGFYNGLVFHRITDIGEKGNSKIVQGGDPNGGAAVESLDKGIKGEFKQNGVNNPLLHNQGAVAMARTDAPNSATSQFYICVNAVHDLDGRYAVFGQVIQGLDVANKLNIGDKMVRVMVVK